ncbi:ATP-binding protein [Chlorogloea sp. CCALA 695]|uniref:ATP-binding protein n=1 Tax=Chlorogloea sp. CCALA 695 TaxID=2107693 RepID=UPI000D07E055|nr:ATP-binding protein [Chlorogloea sp. CCALA 695]PSB25552.1 cyanobacterial phytochrome A [Chlorogloea sp. CCALA 695]
MSYLLTSELTSAQQSNFPECYEEPIHTPGCIQPQGILLVLKEPDFTVVQVSGNTAAFIDIEPYELLGKNLDTILDSQQINYLRDCLSYDNLQDVIPLEITLQVQVKEGLQAFNSNIYRVEGVLILEMEPSMPCEDIRFSSIYYLTKTTVSILQNTVSLEKLCQIAVKELRRLTGFDRIMMYQFDEEWHGTVIAEDRVESIGSFLGLHFPATDIPERARKLFNLSRVRLIENVNSVPVPIIPADNPVTGTPLDLSLSTLRSVSPIHVEYLQNMGVAASITIALTKKGKLWGLVACHHRSPKRVPHETRAVCHFISQVLSLEVAAKEDIEDYKYLMNLKCSQTKFAEYMSQEENFTDGLVKYKPNLLNLIYAKGAALYFNNHCTLLGETPKVAEVERLVNWLDKHSHNEIFCTNSLPRLYEEAKGFKNVASGLLTVRLSKEQKNYILWFRPEVVQNVNWGGDPNQPVKVEEGDLRLHPRKSFALWKETVQLKSLPWKQCEIDAVGELRSTIIVVMLRKADDVAKLNVEMQIALDKEKELSELKSHFVTMTSHEFRTPLATILSSADILQKYSHKLREEQKFTHLQQIQTSVKHMTQLLNDLLLLGKAAAGKLQFEPTPVDLIRFCQALVEELKLINDSYTITFANQGNGTTAYIDEKLLRHILTNLLSNAIKYSSPGGTVHFELIYQAGEVSFHIQDHGIGIPQADQAQLFEAFHRASNVGTISGTGLGLAIVKNSVDLHGGTIIIASEVGVGTTFTVTIPLGVEPR